MGEASGATTSISMERKTLKLEGEGDFQELCSHNLPLHEETQELNKEKALTCDVCGPLGLRQVCGKSFY